MYIKDITAMQSKAKLLCKHTMVSFLRITFRAYMVSAEKELSFVDRLACESEKKKYRKEQTTLLPPDLYR
jgi:hypothetical protein